MAEQENSFKLITWSIQLQPNKWPGIAGLLERQDKDICCYKQPQVLDPSNDKLSVAGWIADGGRPDAVPPASPPPASRQMWQGRENPLQNVTVNTTRVTLGCASYAFLASLTEAITPRVNALTLLLLSLYIRGTSAVGSSPPSSPDPGVGGSQPPAWVSGGPANRRFARKCCRSGVV